MREKKTDAISLVTGANRGLGLELPLGERVDVVRVRRTRMNRLNYWYNAGASVVHAIMALYLALFGVIGVRFWT